MKIFLSGVLLLFSLLPAAQSSYLSVNVSMDSIKAGDEQYKIEMKICEPEKTTERGILFGHDTSAIDFASLKTGEIDCGEYSSEGMPDLISGGDEEVSFNHFKFANQVFAWEKILVFRIRNVLSTEEDPGMYIVMPMRYKSFQTFIKLIKIEFRPGKVIFMSQLKGIYDESRLSITQSLEKEKGVEINDFSLKELLEK
jgi:hypothetical protein